MGALHSTTIAAAALIGLFGTTPLTAQVIEVGDDGSARTFSGPTRFVSGRTGEVDHVLAPVTHEPTNIDSFEKAAQSEKIDVHLLRAVAWAESRGRADAVSSKGALGVMQLMPATAAELGVNPLDRDANINGGARYLARQLTRFRSVPLALAAYNAGPGAVLKWGDIPPYAETRAYVSTIMSRWNKLSPTAVVQPKNVPPPVAKSASGVLLIEVPSL